jgi:predicted outer membrane protein
MVREIWYRHLAIADRLIVEARECIDSHRQHLSALEQDGEDTDRATALLGLLEETLHLMHSHRATILEKVAAYKTLEVSK